MQDDGRVGQQTGVARAALAMLALALGAGGCGSEDGGLASTTECNREPDLSRAISAEFAGEFWDCYDIAGMDVEQSVESCVRDGPGLSAGCAGCYGDYAGCIDTACGESCNARGDDTLPCSQCLMAECVVSLTTCSGVGFPAVLPERAD